MPSAADVAAGAGAFNSEDFHEFDASVAQPTWPDFFADLGCQDAEVPLCMKPSTLECLDELEPIIDPSLSDQGGFSSNPSISRMIDFVLAKKELHKLTDVYPSTPCSEEAIQGIMWSFIIIKATVAWHIICGSVTHICGDMAHYLTRGT